MQQQQQQQNLISGQSTSALMQPKSILKHNNARIERSNTSNPSSPSKQAKSTTFADDRQHGQQHVDNNNFVSSGISNVVRDLNNMSFNESTTSTTTSTYQIKELITNDMSIIDSMNQNMNGPPPPPERNSSYAVMSQKQQTLNRNRIEPGQFMISNKKPILNANNSTNNINDSLSMNSTINNDTNNNGNLSILSMVNSNGNSSTTTTTTTTNTTQNDNNNHNNTSNLSYNVLSSNNLTSTIQSNSNLSLSTMLAGRDNKRVSFHDEENNLILSQSTGGDQAELSIVREDPNVSKFHSFRSILLFPFRSIPLRSGNISIELLLLLFIYFD